MQINKQVQYDQHPAAHNIVLPDWLVVAIVMKMTAEEKRKKSMTALLHIAEEERSCSSFLFSSARVRMPDATWACKITQQGHDAPPAALLSGLISDGPECLADASLGMPLRMCTQHCQCCLRTRPPRLS